jgi:hypothetical protein
MSAHRVREASRISFIPQKTVNVVRGELARVGHKYRVKFERANGKEFVTYHYDFSDHPLRDLIPLFLFEGAEERTGGTINMKCSSLQVLQEFFSSGGENDLTPHTFKEYLNWLADVEKPDGLTRFTPTVVPTHANHAKQLYECGLNHEWFDWSHRDWDAIKNISTKVLRGNRKRGVQKSLDEAISSEAFHDLVKAISLEFEQCKRVLAAREAGERLSLYNHAARGLKKLDPNPYVTLTGLAAVRHGIRSCEVNAFAVGDLCVDEERGEHELYLHAPNKPDDFVPVDDVLVTAWQLCEEWSREARVLAGIDGATSEGPLLVYLSTATSHRKTLVHLTTDHLNEIFLPYFYQKWFDYKIVDDNGCERPLLHADGDATRPFWCNYRKLRNSFAVRFAEREKNRTVVREAMRHNNIITTERYYLQQAQLDHAKKVQIALKHESQWIVMGLKNAALAGVSKETLQKAKDAGAMLPHGLCSSVMAGGGCERAADCLECPHLVVIASRRPRFEADRKAYLEMAEKLQEKGDLRGAENALSRAKICQAHIIRIDQTFGGGIK